MILLLCGGDKRTQSKDIRDSKNYWKDHQAFAHLKLGHRAARQSREEIRQGASTVLSFLLGRAGVPIAGTLSDLATNTISRTFSRDEERESDALGLQFAAQAGFDPSGAVRTWEKMSARDSGSIPFLSTHPGPEERVENMRKLAANLQQITKTVANSEAAAQRITTPEESHVDLPTCTGPYSTATWANCKGELKYSNGNKHDGEFKDGQRSGKGTLTYPNGGQYIGEWKNNLPNGQGTLNFSDERKYVGEWKDGKYHGKGVMYRPDGSIMRSAIWENGNPVLGQALR